MSAQSGKLMSIAGVPRVAMEFEMTRNGKIAGQPAGLSYVWVMPSVDAGPDWRSCGCKKVWPVVLDLLDHRARALIAQRTVASGDYGTICVCACVGRVIG